jgi:Fe-S-cluster containining protein
MKTTGLGWLDIARPQDSDDVDEHGFYHTFEWALRKKENGDCFFLTGGKCAVYAHRPHICRTYPMRLAEDGHRVELYECDGIGSGTMDEAEARRMADALLKRQAAEARESRSLLQKYEAFHPGRAQGTAVRIYVVHDSEGSRKVRVHKDGSCAFL